MQYFPLLLCRNQLHRVSSQIAAHIGSPVDIFMGPLIAMVQFASMFASLAARFHFEMMHFRVECDTRDSVYSLSDGDS
jgi:hypothetical protein